MKYLANIKDDLGHPLFEFTSQNTGNLSFLCASTGKCWSFDTNFGNTLPYSHLSYKHN